MSVAAKKRSGLGRGLTALLGEAAQEQPLAEAGTRPGVSIVAVARLSPHPDQPRRHFDEDALSELAQSISQRGLIQPIVVRPLGDDYQIVAGERRWRAAQRAQLHEVPVIVRDFDESETLEVALIENIQREELNAIEEAEAYRRLIEEYGHTQDVLGRLVHKSRSHVANLLRLLDLPATVRALVAEGQLSMGHARAIATHPDAEALAAEIVARGLSVRQAEALARKGKGTVNKATRRQPSTESDADIRALERQLADMIGLKVTVAHDAPGGTVTLTYSSLDQLDMICQRLSGEGI
ncbi:ParB/RepB/Spo0J family partition protein [Sphingomonas sp. ID0503]|uniref:ParB/RepB/Spo0J family partition protein n=1 Tax=Sphingomonas sp. ID0503 TaxID=3399691 RepID=UPI003AFAA037